MIRRFFYIASTTLFIVTAPNRGINAKALERELLEMEQQQKAPPGFNYQAVIRGTDGNPLANTAVTVRLSVQTAADASGNVHWIETHSATTNEFGLINVVVGEGTVSGGTQTDFASVPWAASDNFLKVEIDQGAGFVDVGTSKFQSVPYARVADNGLSTAEADKLASVANGAEVNVQANWSETDNTEDGFIQNKPDIPTDVSDLTDNSGLLTPTGFSGSFNDLSDVPANLDTDVTDDFSGSFNDLTDVPANLDTDATDDFSGDFNDLTNKPSISFTTAANLTSNANGDLANDSFLFGGAQFNDDGNTDHNKRMFFEKSKGAFRAGGTTGNYWNTRGDYSFAAGKNNTASAYVSFVGGGALNRAAGQASFVGGGVSVSAYGDNAVAVGGGSIQANGKNSSVLGGAGSYALGDYSSITGGRGLQAASFGETAMGIFATYASSPNATSRIDTDRLLVVGNGTSLSSRGDALIMLKNGNTIVNGQLTLANATPGVAATSSFTLPNIDGTTNQVLQTNGSGTVTWVDKSSISSDKRLKTNIRNLTNVIETLTKLEGYKFNWNKIQNRNAEIDEIGLIAQEVQKYYPELVSTDSQGYLRVKYISFIPLLIEAIKELETENNELKVSQQQYMNRFNSLESTVNELMNMLGSKTVVEPGVLTDKD